MALHADEHRQGWIAAIPHLLGPRPGRLEYASRVALICALTALMVEIYQTPSAALSVYVVFFLNKPDRAESVVLDLAFLLLVSLVVGLILVVALLVIDAPFWRVVAMTVISFCFLFLASASRLRPVGAILALIVGYTLDLLGTLQLGELATRGPLYLLLIISIPAGVSIVINLLLAPPPRTVAAQAIAERLRLSAGMLRAPDVRVRRDFSECLHEGVMEIEKRLKLAAAEQTSPLQDVVALEHATRSTASLLVWVDAESRFQEARLPGRLRESAAESLEDMARILDTGGYPLEITSGDSIPAAALPALPARIWANLKSLLVNFAEPVQLTHEASKATSQPGGFFVPDAFTNPEHVRYALKTTAAAMFCYILYSLLNWPGIHTCFITCYIVALTTTAETVEKLTLRIIGCLIGAATGIAAIVFLMPSLTSIGALLSVVFVAAFASAWVAAGSARISYAGFQIAFAFFLCVIQGPAPAFELEIARDRIVGILIGIVTIYVVFAMLWPVSVAPRVDAATTKLLGRLAALSGTPAATRSQLAADAQAALGAIERDLDLAAYEPESVRQGTDWLQSRRRAMKELSSLAAALLLVADEDCAFSAAVARRLENIAAAHDSRTLAPSGDPVTGVLVHRAVRSDTSQRLADAIEMHLRDLDEALLPRITPGRMASHVPA
ncbi:MAG: FUSC family protein, partial [Steroidobacteraceae bacterium]